MDVLYYAQPRPVIGGATNVAYFLTKALAKKVNLTCFPRFTGLNYPADLLHTYRMFFMKRFNIVHFNIVPSIMTYNLAAPRWVDGNYLLLKCAKNRNARTIFNIHGIMALENERSQKKDRFLTLKTMDDIRACKNVDRIVVNSEYMRSKAIAWYGVDRNKIVVLPNGVDLDMFGAVNHRIELSGSPVILYVGKLWWAKGVDLLLDALPMLKSGFPKIKLHIVGNQHDMHDYKLVAKRKGLQEQVIFHGAVPHSRIPYYFKSSDICVFPSRHEAFSIAMLEAMASGTPIVASDIERFREILSDCKNALLFRSGDAFSLSTTILRLIVNPGLKSKISKQALETVGNYCWDNIAERYVTLYRNLCS